jgi:hypothetical protein
VGWGTSDVSVDFAVAVDLEGLIEESLIDCLVIVQCVGVLGPGTDLQFDAEWRVRYKGGFMIYFLTGLIKRFLTGSIGFIIYCY